MTQMIRTKINDQFEIILPKHRADRPEWYTDKGWERERLNSMYGEIGIHEKDVVFYVGAEEGDMAALCKMWNSELVLFEPNCKVWPNIKAIWEANKLDRPILNFVGFAANENYEQIKGLSSDWPECANGEIIGDHGFKELADPGDIPRVKIDSIVDVFRITPTVISMDVEGSEGRVIEGAEETIKKHKPKIWLSGHPEFMFRLYGEYLGDLRQKIKNYGYEETLLAYSHEVHLFYKPI